MRSAGAADPVPFERHEEDGEELHPCIEDSAIWWFARELFQDVSCRLRRPLRRETNEREPAASIFLACQTRAEYLSGKCSSGGNKIMNKNRVSGFCLLVSSIAILAVGANGQEKKEIEAAHKIVHYGDLKWTPIIKGCDIATVEGDFNVEGQPFVIRFRCADGAKTPPHWHPTDEYVTVLKGTFLVGMGETFDEKKLETMNVGNFTIVPKEMRHFAMAKGETIIQVHGIGPFKVNWVNLADVIPPDKPAAAEKPKS
jgi:quercetin dioxygenase-like cupin family protein